MTYQRPPTPQLRPRLPRPLFEEWSWQLEGSCLGYPSVVFYPDESRRGDIRRREEEAKAICRGCPVLQPCREYSLNAPEVHGIWGGMTAKERVSHGHHPGTPQLAEVRSGYRPTSR